VPRKPGTFTDLDASEFIKNLMPQRSKLIAHADFKEQQQGSLG
jgi:hypothetical protein